MGQRLRNEARQGPAATLRAGKALTGTNGEADRAIYAIDPPVPGDICSLLVNFLKNYGRMAVEFLDLPGRGGKPSSNIPGGICWLDLVVLVVERADRQSASGLGPMF